MTKKNNIYFLLFSVSTLFILFCGSYNTPLHPYNSGDMCIFKVMGEGWLHGAIPYKDLFDHKGPYIYLIQMLGLFIEGNKWGIYLLSVINLFISLCLLYEIGRLMQKDLKNIAIGIASVLLLYFATIGSGDLTEEWSLPFQIYALYLFYKYQDNYEITKWYEILLFGFCCGVLVLTRLNNLCLNCAFAVVLLFYFCKKKLWAKLLSQMCLALIGLMIAIVPFVLYFYINDAFQQMIEANFIFNIEYSKLDVPFVRVILNILKMTPILGFLVFLSWKKNKKTSSLVFLFVCNAIITFLAYYKSKAYSHYYMILIPSLFLLILYLQERYNFKQICLFLIILFLPFTDSILKTVYFNLTNSFLPKSSSFHKSGLKYREMGKIIGFIPESDREHIYCYGVPNELPGIFLLLNTYPCGKYFYNQDWFSMFSEKKKDEILKYFKNAEVKYVITDEENTIESPVRETIMQNCELVYRSDVNKFKIALYKKVN